jgi:hypothetical protein
MIKIRIWEKEMEDDVVNEDDRVMAVETVKIEDKVELLLNENV